VQQEKRENGRCFEIKKHGLVFSWYFPSNFRKTTIGSFIPKAKIIIKFAISVLIDAPFTLPCFFYIKKKKKAGKIRINILHQISILESIFKKFEDSHKYKPLFIINKYYFVLY